METVTDWIETLQRAAPDWLSASQLWGNTPLEWTIVASVALAGALLTRLIKLVVVGQLGTGSDHRSGEALVGETSWQPKQHRRGGHHVRGATHGATLLKLASGTDSWLRR